MNRISLIILIFVVTFCTGYSPYALPFVSDLSLIRPPLNPSSAAHFTSALQHASSGNLDGAMEELLAANALQPNHPLYMMSIGSIHYYRGNSDESIRYYQTAARQGRHGDTAHDLACVRLGKLFIEREMWEEAMDALRFGVGIYGHLPDALYRLVYLMHFSCDFTRRDSLQAAVKASLLAEVKTENFTYMTPSQTLMFLEDAEIALVTMTFAMQNTEVTCFTKTQRNNFQFEFPGANDCGKKKVCLAYWICLMWL